METEILAASALLTVLLKIVIELRKIKKIASNEIQHCYREQLDRIEAKFEDLPCQRDQPEINSKNIDEHWPLK
jgi:hypothetical protein